ncbi:MAG: prepilin peptidase [Dehalococcoidales bacterium]|nr:prepilin peptidase [Dehalococcoidales bacterium]
MLITLAAIIGLFTGSFLNVCIDRLPRGESIVFPPSHCESCNHKLGVFDLIPVFSYIFLRGGCRYCRVKIPIRLMIVELVTGVLFGFFFWKYGFSLELLVFIIYGSILIVIFVIDLEHQLVLDIITFPAMIIAFVIAFFRPEITSVTSLGSGSIDQAVSQAASNAAGQAIIALLGGITGLVAMSIPFIIYPSGMGMGDIKLAALVGLMTGYPLVILALIVSWISGGIIAGILLALKIKGRKDPIPAAVFMVVAALVTLLWGQEIWNWYF